MRTQDTTNTPKKTGEVRPELKDNYYIRKLALSGSSRYLSVSTILPKEWEAVKVYVLKQSQDRYELAIVPIK